MRIGSISGEKFTEGPLCHPRDPSRWLGPAPPPPFARRRLARFRTRASGRATSRGRRRLGPRRRRPCGLVRATGRSSSAEDRFRLPSRQRSGARGGAGGGTSVGRPRCPEDPGDRRRLERRHKPKSPLQPGTRQDVRREHASHQVGPAPTSARRSRRIVRQLASRAA